MKITIVRLGYVGLALAILIAYKGFDVRGFDINEKKTKDFPTISCVDSS